MIQKNLEQLKIYLQTPTNIVVIGHRNPDGDAMGATLGLTEYLQKKGHKVRVVVPNEFPSFLRWLPNSDAAYRFDWQNSQSIKAIEKSDIVFLIDFNALHRLGSDMENFMLNYQNDFVLIDHHQQPDEFAYMYSDTQMCSTCQMVYHFIEKMGDIDLIDSDIATCLYTGIMTDTGSFRFRSTTSLTHRVIANLIDCGAQNDRIHSNVYDTNSYGRLQLLGHALQNLKILAEYKTAYITISNDAKVKNNFKKGDTEGIVNYALSVKGVVLAAIFIEDKEQEIIKISLRSKGRFSVNQFARKYFNGGGHDNAAGGKLNSSMSEAVKKFVLLISNYKSELETSYEA